MSNYQIFDNNKLMNEGLCTDIRYYFDPIINCDMISFTDVATKTVISICSDFVKINHLAA